MIKLPKLNSLESSRSMISAFGGYDHRLVTSEGSFYNENNLTSDNYPVLSTRAEHGVHTIADGHVDALLVKDKLCYIANNTVYIGEDSVTLPLLNGRNIKQVVSMGAYIVILDTEKELHYVNTLDLTDNGRVTYIYGSDGDTTYYISDENGNIPTEEKPDNPTDGDLVYVAENGSGVISLEKYFGGAWEKIKAYTTIEAEGIHENFHVGESVFFINVPAVSPCLAGDYSALNKDAHTITSVNPDKNSITVDFSPNTIYAHLSTPKRVMVERRSRPLDYITVSNNRLWGCFYGEGSGGFVNEIYASKLGDFKNFDYYPGTAADSYSVSLGSDGNFTGAITYQGNPAFFKEGVIHRVVGTLPTNYQMQTTECQGVKEGSCRSLAIIDNVLFYHAPSGIYAFDGSLPQLVSFAFGNESYSNAVGGAYLRKYYVNMKGADGVYATFVYDVNNGVWHKQDEGNRIDMFASADDALYFTMVDRIYTMFGSGEFESKPLKWYAESGIIGTESPDRKYLSRLTFRMALAFESTIVISIEYDSSPEWTPVAMLMGTSLNSFSIPIKIERCDHFRVRLEGTGECKVFSITKTMERGGEE